MRSFRPSAFTRPMKSFFPTAIPAMTSPWPFRYFVAEWTTTSAPKFERALDDRGAVCVVHHEHGIPFPGNAGESGEVCDVHGGIRRGFAVDHLVLGRIEAFTAARSVRSMKSA